MVGFAGRGAVATAGVGGGAKYVNDSDCASPYTGAVTDPAFARTWNVYRTPVVSTPEVNVPELAPDGVPHAAHDAAEDVVSEHWNSTDDELSENANCAGEEKDGSDGCESICGFGGGDGEPANAPNVAHTETPRTASNATSNPRLALLDVLRETNRPINPCTPDVEPHGHEQDSGGAAAIEQPPHPPN